MTTCHVASCDRPVTDAWVCARCAHDLERALGDIPAVVHQLNLTLAKQTRYADRNERGGNEQPLPMDPLASAASSELRAHLVAWVWDIGDRRGWDRPAGGIDNPGGEPTTDTLARWMLHHVEWLRHYEHGHYCVEELTGDMRTARRVIDVPANRTTFPVGPCPELTMVKITYHAVFPPGISDPDTRHGLTTTETPTNCLGEVRAYIPNTDTQPARLECSACHTVWESWQWLRAGRRIKDREATMKGTAA
jgi:hypothetical protein